MRLLFITLQISPYHHARFLRSIKYFDDIHVISTQNTGDFREFVSENITGYPVYRLFDGREAYRDAASSGALASKVRGLLSTIKPDAIAVSGWAMPESLAALAYGREHRLPVIIMSETQGDDSARSTIREAIKSRVVSQFDASLVGGPPHAAYIEILGMPRDRIHLGYNAVDNGHFITGAATARTNASILKTQYGLPDRYILASSRFIAKKNIPNLIMAYAKARLDVVDSPDLVILGDGIERPAVEAAIVKSGAGEHIHLPGFRRYRDLPAMYALSEGFVHVPTVEQWGLVINEAMASSTPVIATRPCGAARTVLEDGVSGILTDPDAPSIANALIRLFRMTPDERINMGLLAASAIGQWGPERFGAGMKAAVQSALDVPLRGAVSRLDGVILGHLQRKVIDTIS